MALVYAGIIPNHPSLISDAQANEPNTSTGKALQLAEGELYFAKPDTLVLLTQYGIVVPERENINAAPQPSCSDMSETRTQWKTDLELVSMLQHKMHSTAPELRATVVAEEHIVQECATPLCLLLHHLQDAQIVVIATGAGSAAEHRSFGNFLQHEVTRSNKRIGVVATGHLTASGNHNRAFDEVVLQSLRSQSFDDILDCRQQLIQQSATDLYGPLAVLLGVLDPYAARAEVLSYEQIFDQSQLVVQFQLG